jgi:hypothetical protein
MPREPLPKDVRHLALLAIGAPPQRASATLHFEPLALAHEF